MIDSEHHVRSAMSIAAPGSSAADAPYARAARGHGPSFWLAQAGELHPRSSLAGDREADVCIVGAGFTGLWTAYELKRADAALEVVVLESRFAGFGASGRNGGWVLGQLAGPSDRWLALGGPDGARGMMRAIRESVDEVGRVVSREGIACDYVKGGTLTVACSAPQLARLRGSFARDRADAIGREQRELLDAHDAGRRVTVAGLLGASFMPECARVQPARLVRGLAGAAERAGVVIHEASPVQNIEPGAAVCVHGRVRARHIVRATEGYSARLPGLRRSLLPMNSAMIVTEPLGDDRWAQIGWAGAETLSDAAHLYVYLQRTADGRIAIGGRGVPYRFGSRTDREGPVPARTVAELHERLSALFPAARDARIDGAWAGVLGVARDWMPRVGFDRATGIAWAGGYVGEGVAAANLAGRTLRDLLLGRDSELARLPWVRGASRDWEPEPLRFAGARGVYGLYRLADRREAHTGRAAVAARVAAAVAGR